MIFPGIKLTINFTVLSIITTRQNKSPFLEALTILFIEDEEFIGELQNQKQSLYWVQDIF